MEPGAAMAVPNGVGDPAATDDPVHDLTATPSVPAASVDPLAEAIEVHHRRLTGLAYVLCGDRDQAEDIVADAYARVWPKVRDERVDDLMPYLRRAVVNQVQGRRRRRRLEQREADRRRGDRAQVSGDFERGVDDHLGLVDALLGLPVDQRVVIVLRHVEDLSERDTAEVLGISPGTVKSRSARGLAALREALGDDVAGIDDTDPTGTPEAETRGDGDV